MRQPGAPESVRYPIGLKIMSSFVLLVVLLGGALTFEARRSLGGNLSRQIDLRAGALAESIAAQTPDHMNIGDYYTLYQLLLTSLEHNEDVRYIFILNADGDVVASTFGSTLPPGLAEVNSLRPGEARRVTVIATPEGMVRDVAVPLPGGAGEGVVRVGVSETAARQAVAATTRRLLLVISLVLVAGTIAAFGLIHALTRSLQRLVKVTRAFAAGDLSRRAGLVSRDEIGVLGVAFDQMADNIQRLVEELQRKESARLQLLRKVISAQEEERKRVARELHDEIGQCFTSLAVGLRALEQLEDAAEMRRRAGELRALAAAAVEDVQHLSRLLRPSVLDDLGLGPALERCAREMTLRFGFPVRVSLVGLEERLPMEVETALYRIIQEGLTNVGRHARATEARVLVERRGGEVVAVIEDDGRGFDARALLGEGQEADRYLGIFGMQERATLIGGTLTLESEPGRGTRITVRVPVPAGREGRRHGQDQAAAG